MKEKFILVSGSASHDCPPQMLDIATEFVRYFTRQVLDRGGGLVVLAGNEDSTKDSRGVPRIFDWIVLREVEAFAGKTVKAPRKYARVVMSDQAIESAISDPQIRLLTNLQQRNVVEVKQISRDRFTGGDYRLAQTEMADAMLAIGGGKGTYVVGLRMLELGKPVLPMELKIGSFSEDGEGSIALRKEMINEPERFFRQTHRNLMNQIATINLTRRINDAQTVGQVATDIFEAEFSVEPRANWHATSAGRLGNFWRATKALPVISAAIKIVEWLSRLGS